MDWVCGSDGVRYSVGAPCCPQCGAEDPRDEEGRKIDMGKISKHGGATDAATGLGFEDDGVTPLRDDEERPDVPEPALASDDLDQTTEAEQEGGEQFDPAVYTAAEVTAYLADADEAETARVIEAERGGKNRSSIVNYTR